MSNSVLKKNENKTKSSCSVVSVKGGGGRTYAPITTIQNVPFNERTGDLIGILLPDLSKAFDCISQDC